MKHYDIVAIGEGLIDFLGVSGADDIRLLGNPGGGPPNMLAAAAKLGRRTAFISKVGNDIFGDFFRKKIAEAGIEYRGVVSDAYLTTLAIVSLDESGDRSFAFYRERTADIMLSEDDLDLDLLRDCKILHFSTVNMTKDPARSANFTAVRHAKEAGAKISFDPNFREFLWNDKDEAIHVASKGLALADYAKLGEEEAAMLSGETNPEKAARAIFDANSLTFLAVTLGAEGSIAVTADGFARVPSYDVKTVDTTGSGDAFWGAALHRLLSIEESASETPDLRDEILTNILSYANASGAHASTSKGGIPSVASEDDIANCMATAVAFIH
ncbi:MAG: carbohydrate kinase [Clostridiales Family XIII bacterium]|jgi:fructokinase|nr:carbohydrate kinase [Clostridiales Family XIII bacterium]